MRRRAWLHIGVRGAQGKKRNKFQAYMRVDSKKQTVPGLYKSAHEAAVALAQFKLHRELGLEEEPAEKKQRKRRRSMAAEEPTPAGSTSCSRWRQPLQPLTLSSLYSSPLSAVLRCGAKRFKI